MNSHPYHRRVIGYWIERAAELRLQRDIAATLALISFAINFVLLLAWAAQYIH